MFIGICSRSQVSVYRTIGPLVDLVMHVLFHSIYRVGLDLYKGVVRDNKKAGVLEPAVSKIKSLKFATEAAITILRIDDMIKLAPEKKDENTYENALRSGAL